MLVFGHRGFPLRAPENTAAGVAAAFDAGAAGVEVDVRRTEAGLLVCSHDPLEPGRAYDPVEAVLDAARGRGRVVLEVKNIPGEPDFDAPAEATAKLLLELLAGREGDDVVVSSFDWFAIELARGSVPTGFLTPPGIAAGANLAYVVETGHAECHPHYTAVLEEPGVVAAAHEQGVRVVCWTVDDPEVAARLAELGVDAIISNVLL